MNTDSRYITLDLYSLTPATLAAIVADLDEQIGQHTAGRIIATKEAAYEMLVSIVDFDEADEMVASAQKRRQATPDPATLYVKREASR